MKKLFIVSAVMLMGVSAMFVSCKKDSIENGCTCTATTNAGESEEGDVTKAEVEKAGVKSCSAYAAYIENKYKSSMKTLEEQAAKMGISVDELIERMGVEDPQIKSVSCKGK